MRITNRSPLVAFLNERQTHSSFSLDAVRVQPVPGGAENQCLLNAVKLMESEQIKIVSGWLYIRKPGMNAQFTQHWWNFDEARGLYLDCSPEIEDNAIHILDLEIAMYAAQHEEMLESCVCSSVLVGATGFSLVDYNENAGYVIRPTPSLSVDVLFSRHIRQRGIDASEKPSRRHQRRHG